MSVLKIFHYLCTHPSEKSNNDEKTTNSIITNIYNTRHAGR